MGIIVTGAAGHLGRAIAAELAGAGIPLLLTDRDGDGLERVAAAAGGAEKVVLDLSAPAANEELVGRARGLWSEIDGCVAASGIEGPVAPVEALDPAEVEAVFRANVFSIFWLAAAIVPVFKAQGRGRFVPIASGAGLAGGAYGSAYHASKHAVVGLTRSMARELAPSGVSVNAVCPGYVDSPMVDRILAAEASITGSDPDPAASIPAGRMAEPSEVARVVKYLVADAPDYLNGTCLVLDGALRA